MTQQESYVQLNADGTAASYNGPDATNFFRAACLRSSIGLYAATGILPTRGVTITRLMAMVTGYTGKSYKRGQYVEAQKDLTIWLDAMRSALPVVGSSENLKRQDPTGSDK